MVRIRTVVFVPPMWFTSERSVIKKNFFIEFKYNLKFNYLLFRVFSLLIYNNFNLLDEQERSIVPG
jgi:hypothetical protein